MVKTVYCSIQKWYYFDMKIYHGSKQLIESPIPFGSKKDNDYGPAFYMTRDLESAHEWACRNNSIGIVNEYNFETKGLKILDLTNKNKYSVLHWLAILIHFRDIDSSVKNSFPKRLQFIEDNYYIDVNKYDLVIGYRADDAYFRFPIDFIRGNLTLEQLEESFNLGKLGIQYVLISPKSFKSLNFVKSIQSSPKYIGRYFDTINKATNRFNSLDKDEEGTRITDVMKENKK